MANEEHLAILKKGVEEWNRWRKREPGIRPDLRGANLSKADFKFADFRWAYMEGGDLMMSSFELADFSGANLNGAFAGQAKFHGANCQSADLTKCHLEFASLIGTNLREAILFEANTNDAELYRANLTSANLRKASLRNAVLTDSCLNFSILDDADLTRAHLGGANLTATSLLGTILEESVMGFTSLSNLDLGAVRGLETVVHLSPSTIGIDTIYESNGQIPEVFLRGAGLPEPFIVQMKALVAAMEPIQFYSCFISYSSEDEEFSKKLYDDLKGERVRCWRFAEDAKWGNPLWDEIDRPIHKYEKIVVICSRSSLNSRPVLREIERALQREDKEKRSVLFPIRIDDYVFDGWEHARKPDVLSKVIGDFRGWKEHDKYKNAFERLMRDLRA